MPELANCLLGKACLIIEDDALIALGLISYLQTLGGIVTWEANLPSALDYVYTNSIIDFAIVDLNLNGSMSSPVIDNLMSRGVFTILCTGYEEDSIEARFRDLPRSEKPFTRAQMQNIIIRGLQQQ